MTATPTPWAPKTTPEEPDRAALVAALARVKAEGPAAIAAASDGVAAAKAALAEPEAAFLAAQRDLWAAEAEERAVRHGFDNRRSVLERQLRASAPAIIRSFRPWAAEQMMARSSRAWDADLPAPELLMRSGASRSEIDANDKARSARWAAVQEARKARFLLIRQAIDDAEALALEALDEGAVLRALAELQARVESAELV